MIVAVEIGYFTVGYVSILHGLTPVVGYAYNITG
jgi:hypothetical protein